jgi:hypothetical protein
MSNVRAIRQFGLTIQQAEHVEAIVRSVPPEFQSILRMSIIIGIGEATPGKPFQDIASRIVRNFSVEVES